MNAELMERCELLVRNRDAIQTAFAWDNPSMTLAGSSFYVGLNREADTEKLKECAQILKQNAGFFSEYRNNVKMPLLCKMAVVDNPEQYLKAVQDITAQLKSLKWVDNAYRIVAAMTICDHTEPAEVPATIEKITGLYHEMKKNHPWLTSGEDIPFAAMLAVSEMDTAALTAEMENCYQILKEHFYDYDAVQSLSHVLAADETPAEEKCRKVEQLFDLLKEQKHKYGTGQELAVLGTLCMLNLPIETIAEEIIEADDYLKTQKGFGDLTMGSKARRMYAALMVMDTHATADSFTHESVLDTMLTVVITMEILLIVMMTSMTVSISSSH